MTIYEKAAARILVPGQWTQGANARDAGGRRTFPLAPVSTCWCAWGALTVEFKGDGVPDTHLGLDVVEFNDTPGRTAEEAALAILLIGVSKDDL